MTGRDQGLEGANPVSTDPPITEDVEMITDMHDKTDVGFENPDVGRPGMLVDVPVQTPYDLYAGEGRQYLDRWYGQFESKEVLQESVAKFIHDKYRSLSEMWFAGELCEAVDLDLILASAQGHACKAGRRFVLACPVAISSLALSLFCGMAEEESWLRNVLIESRTPVFVPIFQDAHYCSLYIDPKSCAAYWFDSLGIREELAAEVRLALADIGFELTIVREKWQLDSWSCGLWTALLYFAINDYVELESHSHDGMSVIEWLREAFLKGVWRWNPDQYVHCLKRIHCAIGMCFKSGIDARAAAGIVYGRSPAEVRHLSSDKSEHKLCVEKVYGCTGRSDSLPESLSESHLQRMKDVSVGDSPKEENSAKCSAQSKTVAPKSAAVEWKLRTGKKCEILGFLKHKFELVCQENKSGMCIQFHDLLATVKQHQCFDVLTDVQIRNAWHRYINGVKKAKMRRCVVEFTSPNPFSILEDDEAALEVEINVACMPAGGCRESATRNSETSDTKVLQREVLGILKQKFESICKENTFGTRIPFVELLATVRHQEVLKGLTDVQIRSAWYRFINVLKKKETDKRVAGLTLPDRNSALPVNATPSNGIKVADIPVAESRDWTDSKSGSEAVRTFGSVFLQAKIGEILHECGFVNKDTLCTKLELLYLSEHTSLLKSSDKKSLQQAIYRWHKQVPVDAIQPSGSENVSLPDLSKDVRFSAGLEEAVQMSLSIELYNELKHSIPLPVLFKHVQQFCYASPKGTWTPKLNGLLVKQVQKLRSEHSDLEEIFSKESHQAVLHFRPFPEGSGELTQITALTTAPTVPQTYFLNRRHSALDHIQTHLTFRPSMNNSSFALQNSQNQDWTDRFIQPRHNLKPNPGSCSCLPHLWCKTSHSLYRDHSVRFWYAQTCQTGLALTEGMPL